MRKTIESKNYSIPAKSALFAGLMLALLQGVASADVFAQTQFDEATLGATSFTPGGGDTELGWALSGDFDTTDSGVQSSTWQPTETGSGTSAYTIASPSGTQVLNFTEPFNGTSTLLLDNVTGLDSFTGKEVSVTWIPTAWVGAGGGFDAGGFESGSSGDRVQIYVDISEGASSSTLTLFDSTNIVNELNGVSSGTAFRSDSISLADTVTEAQVRIEFQNVNSREAAGFDSITITAIPEPSTLLLTAIFGMVGLLSCRRYIKM